MSPGKSYKLGPIDGLNPHGNADEVLVCELCGDRARLANCLGTALGPVCVWCAESVLCQRLREHNP